MPLLHTSESYDGLPSLYANAGKWIDCIKTFSTQYLVGSNAQNTFTYTSTGTQHYISASNLDFGTSGLILGDVINIHYSDLNTGVVYDYTRTISFINGTDLFITASLPTASGSIMPLSGNFSNMVISSVKLPASIQTIINLTQDGSSSLGSLIDGSYNLFEVQDTSAMAVTDTLPMVQIGDKSGGLIEDVELTYTAVANDGWNDFTITYKMWQSVVIKDGFAEPNAYLNADCVAPIVNIKAFSIYGNPNGVLEGSSANNQANTGGFDENYNGGLNNYSFQNIQFQDLLGNNIDSVNYSGASTFTATITAPNQDIIASTYTIGMMFRPVDGTIYQNKITTLGQNLLVNSPDVDFSHSLTPDLTVYQGYENSDGARFDFTDLQFTQSGGVLTVTGKITPNSACTTYFSNFADGERLTTMFVGLGNHSLVGQFSDRVHLIVLNEDNIDAPVLGVQIPDVVNEFLYDHGLNDITATGLTTTEDDVLYTSDFRLIDDVAYEGVRTRIYAYNVVSEDEFTLEDNFFSFTNTVNIAGQFQPNFVLNRGFNLPPATDRNIVSLVREPSLDIAGKYGVRLQYGFLNDWRYWQQLSNVDNDFFDVTEPFDGKNKNWQRFSESGNWIIRIAYYTRVNGVDDFNYFKEIIRPYEDDVNMSTSVDYTIVSTGQSATNLLSGELMLVEATLTNVAFAYSLPWFEATYENKEGARLGVISTEYPQGNVASNPLKPININGGLEVNYTAPNVAVLSFYVDTTILTVTDCCLSFRAFSLDKTPLPVDGVQFQDDTFAQFQDGTVVEFN